MKMKFHNSIGNTGFFLFCAMAVACGDSNSNIAVNPKTLFQKDEPQSQGMETEKQQPKNETSDSSPIINKQQQTVGVKTTPVKMDDLSMPQLPIPEKPVQNTVIIPIENLPCAGMIPKVNMAPVLKSPFVQLKSDFQFTEGPTWIKALNQFYFSDNNTGIQYLYSVEKKNFTTGPTFDKNTINGNATDNMGRLLGVGGTEGTIRRSKKAIDSLPSRDSFEVLVAKNASGFIFKGTNDLAVSEKGIVYFTDPDGYGDKVFAAFSDGKVKVFDALTKMANGVTLSPDQKTLYVGSVTNGNKSPNGAAIFKFDILADGSLSAGQLFASQQGANCCFDGMRTDALGRLFASGPGKEISVFDKTGKLVEKLNLPVQPTNIAFGGVNGTDVFVTAGSAVFLARSAIPGAQFTDKLCAAMQ